MSEQTQTYIVTYKSKDKRSDKKTDKAELFQNTTKSKASIVDTSSLMRMPHADSIENIVLDINRYEVPIISASLTGEQVSALRKDSNVVSVEPDGKCYALYTIQDQPTPTSETVPWGIDRVKATQTWDITRGKGIKVAVCDTGIDYTHPDLSPNYKGGISFVPTESDPKDFNRHGTHVSGTIAAAANGIGVIGIAPSAYLYAVKILNSGGSGNWSWLIAGIDWCINNGMHVLNMSLGGASAPTALQSMCDLAWSKGLLLIAAAGNSGPPDNTVGYPAMYGSVVAVSAIDSANTIASFSSRGPKVELCAPGVDILSTVPGGGYGNLSGTSMACPHVTGCAALALSTHRWPPGAVARNVAIRRLLAATADNLGIPGRDNLYGFGRVDAEEAAFSLTIPPSIPGIP
ncbi:MAG TPA: S8 family serine peptidase [Nitrososphaeraceae archaeon]|jgi:subtilisin